MRKTSFLSFGVLTILAGSCFAENTNPAKVFEEVIATYKSLQTYKAEGTITADINDGNGTMCLETSFSILLKKPNLYLIRWTQKNMPMPGMAQWGTVWNEGNQPYLYIGIMNGYAKMGSDGMALASATGFGGGGATFTIPSIFLNPFRGQPSPFCDLKEPNLERTEKIGGEKCYVISGSSPASKKETFWISKSRHLILKYSRSLESSGQPDATPEPNDAQIEEVIKGMGLEVTEESKKRMMEMTKDSNDTELHGFSTEIHREISSPELRAEDFHFAVPQGTVFKKSLFDGFLKPKQ
jgi:hypothetical protein